MDTKWKNRKNAISFLIFFIGVSLVLGNAINILQDLSGETIPQYVKQVLSDDYQQSRPFRSYVANRLENFLAMATNSFGYSNYFDYGYYYDYGTAYCDTTDVFEDIWEGIEQQAVAKTQEPDYYYDFDYDFDYDFNYDEEDINDGKSSSLTKEQLNEKLLKIAQSYHDHIKGDKNLLYSVLYDGKVLYTNAESLGDDGSLSTSEDYNFLLCYADGKVRIMKDGQELDIYGDGYYREDSEWYVPGYRNFTVDEEMKKATVYMAVAREPLQYMEGTHRSGNYRQIDNSLYWMSYQQQRNRIRLSQNGRDFLIGLALLLLSCFTRKSRRAAKEKIAHFTGKLWLEGKIIIWLLLICLVFARYITNEYSYDLWQEFLWVYRHDGLESAGIYGRLMLARLPALCWIILFWGIYLTINELKYNKRVWRNNLTAKLYKAFLARELRQPISRRMAHRNGIALGLAGFYSLLLLSGTWLCPNLRTGFSRNALLLLLGLTTVGFLLAEYLICARNLETAGDIEALSDRIGDIRNGDYTKSELPHAEASGNRFAGHDLDHIMSQLEDIRHGMARAVDEQMRSQRMKVELIANVSHDIKTPLTSIISYVQFLKEEEGLPDHVKDYVTILDEKSQRLKNMVQDVFAVSKAASGELPMHMETLDFGKLLRQTMADMEEQIADSKLTFRTEIPDAPVMILADGQRMYRVFQNLFQNAIQYSLDSSRVYVTLKTEKSTAIASVKNTSHTELEKDKDFTERFTRGDRSRTDGGSGLGLSIAQSFTEACGGEFHLDIDADLFTVTVAFQIH